MDPAGAGALVAPRARAARRRTSDRARSFLGDVGGFGARTRLSEVRAEPRVAGRLLFSDAAAGCARAFSSRHPRSWSSAAPFDFPLAGALDVARGTQKALRPGPCTETL